MQTTVKERLISYLKHKGYGQNKFENLAGISNGYISNLKSEPGASILTKILNAAPDLNDKWLLTGEGAMLNNNVRIEEPGKTGIPFYKEVPVSAGKGDMMLLDNNESVVGSINLPGVAGKFAFPVVGCSMEPIIHAGDVVVVDEMINWERIDPDKIYLIFTFDDRMIKHLETDDTNKEILWCVSPNYNRFPVRKNEITRMFRVTFYGRLV